MTLFLVISMWTLVAFSLAPSIGRRLARMSEPGPRRLELGQLLRHDPRPSAIAVRSLDGNCSNCPVCRRVRAARATAARLRA